MKKGFTLIELLVVVLIIGVLSAIAIPMYQGAVDKSHWSTMLPGAKAIKDAEEAFKMSNDGYTDTMANLDVTMENNDLTFSLITPNNTSDPNVIRVTNSKLANVRLASYLDDNPKFAGQLHCEALAGDERANRLCGGLLQGQELTSADGYTGYLLDQSIDKATCDNASRTWSNKQTKCYKTEKDRCEANGMPYQNGFCGYQGGDNRTVEEGGVCSGAHDCNDSTFNPGASCVTKTYAHETCLRGTFDGATCFARGVSCSGTFMNGSICKAIADPEAAHSCSGTFLSGSQCIADYPTSCESGTFKEGSKCVANQPNTCGNDFAPGNHVTYDGGCCEGEYCPRFAPKC